MEDAPVDPVLGFVAHIIQNGSPLVNTMLLIIAAVLWYRNGMPGFKRTAPPSYEGEDMSGEMIAPSPMPMPVFPSAPDNSQLERKVENLAKEIRKTREDLILKLAEYREEVRTSVREHEQEDKDQFKEIAGQIGEITGMLNVMTGGQKHA